MANGNNLQAAQETYAAFGRGDIAEVLNGFTDDVEWDAESGPANVPIFGTMHGKQEVAEWFRVLGEEMEFQRFEPYDWIAQGDKVVVLIHSDAIVRRTGKRAVNDLVHVLTYRDGKGARFQEFSNSDALIAAYQEG